MSFWVYLGIKLKHLSKARSWRVSTIILLGHTTSLPNWHTNTTHTVLSWNYKFSRGKSEVEIHVLHHSGVIHRCQSPGPFSRGHTVHISVRTESLASFHITTLMFESSPGQEATQVIISLTEEECLALPNCSCWAVTMLHLRALLKATPDWKTEPSYHISAGHSSQPCPSCVAEQLSPRCHPTSEPRTWPSTTTDSC